MAELSSPAYAHKYFVDGSPTAWDAYFGGWKTVLVGTTGAAARRCSRSTSRRPTRSASATCCGRSTPRRRSAPARRSTPSTPGASASRSARRWLPSCETAIGRQSSATGYGSASNEASLYVVRISDGQLIRRNRHRIGTAARRMASARRRFTTSTATTSTTSSTRRTCSATSGSSALADSDAGSWKIAYDAADGFPKGAPLFQARNATNGVQPSRHGSSWPPPPPASPDSWCCSATGRFFAVGDNTDTTRQSFYGIWDNGSPVAGRGALQEQTGGHRHDRPARRQGPTVRTVSSMQSGLAPASAAGTSTCRPRLERVIGTAVVRTTRVIFTDADPVGRTRANSAARAG